MDRETARVEAFSDGVFGIAMTLLILEFRVPQLEHGSADAGRELIHALLKLWLKTAWPAPSVVTVKLVISDCPWPNPDTSAALFA